MAGEQAGAFLGKNLRRHAAGFKFRQMPAGKPLIGRQQDGAIEFTLPARQFQVMPVLVNMDVQEECLAGTGGAPKGQLAQIIRGVGGKLIPFRLVSIEGGELVVETGHQLVGVPEIAVEVNFGEQQPQILEVFPTDRLRPPGADGLGVADDVLIVGQQPVAVESLVRERPGGNDVIKPGNVVFVHALKRGVVQAFCQRAEGISREQAENPLMEDQALVTPQGGRLRFAGSANGGWGGGGQG